MKKLISIVVIMSLLINSQPSQATFFTDLFGGLFTIVSYPIQLILGSMKSPFFASQNPFVEKEWHKEERVAAGRKAADNAQPEGQNTPTLEAASPTPTPSPTAAGDEQHFFTVRRVVAGVGVVVFILWGYYVVGNMFRLANQDRAWAVLEELEAEGRRRLQMRLRRLFPDNPNRQRFPNQPVHNDAEARERLQMRLRHLFPDNPVPNRPPNQPIHNEEWLLAMGDIFRVLLRRN
jgi:hypothetical protein